MPAKAGKALFACVAVGITAFKLGSVVYRLVKSTNGGEESTLVEKMLAAGSAQMESLFGMFSEAQRVKNERLQQISEELEGAKGEAADLRQKCASQLSEIDNWKARAIKAEAETKESQRLFHELSLESAEQLSKLLESTEQLSQLRDINTDLTAQLSASTSTQQLALVEPESRVNQLKSELASARAEITSLHSKLQCSLTRTEADEVGSTGNDDVELFEAEVDKMVTLASGHVLCDRNQSTAVAESGRKSLRVRLTVLEKEHALLKRGMEVANEDRDALKRKVKEAEELTVKRAAAWAKKEKKLLKKLQQYSDAQAAASKACTEAELLASESGEALAQAQTHIVQLEGKGQHQ